MNVSAIWPQRVVLPKSDGMLGSPEKFVKNSDSWALLGEILVQQVTVEAKTLFLISSPR